MRMLPASNLLFAGQRDARGIALSHSELPRYFRPMQLA